MSMCPFHWSRISIFMCRFATQTFWLGVFFAPCSTQYTQYNIQIYRVHTYRVLKYLFSVDREIIYAHTKIVAMNCAFQFTIHIESNRIESNPNCVCFKKFPLFQLFFFSINTVMHSSKLNEFGI